MVQPELEAVIHSDTYANYHWIQRALILRKGNLVKNVRQLKGAALSKVPPLAIRYRAG